MENVQKQQSQDQAIIDELQALRAENARLRNGEKKGHAVSFKVNTFTDKKTGEVKTNIMVHGITPKPFPLYGSQAELFCDKAEELRKVVNDNRAKLSWKSAA